MVAIKALIKKLAGLCRLERFVRQKQQNMLLYTPNNSFLISLEDMLRIYAHKYIELGKSIQEASTIFSFIETAKDHGDHNTEFASLRPEEITDLKRTLTEIKSLCKDLELPVSCKLISNSLSSPPQTNRELKILLDAVDTELKQRLFVFVPPRRTSYYENNSLISNKCKESFPSITREIKDAGKAYALGLFTACVFHSMRAAEIALRLMAIGLNISKPENLQWQTIIEQIEKEIKKFQQLPNTTENKKEDLTFYSNAATQFMYFKDAWRNHVSHSRTFYDEEDSLMIMNHVRDFIEVLSAKLKE